MNYSNQFHDSISTVQLCPFGEDQWNRIVTYSPIYLHWTDFVMMSPKRTTKQTSGKRNLLHSIDINSMKLDDEILLNEIDDLRREAIISALKQKNSYHQTNVLDEEHDGRTTSPVDEYQRSTDFFYQTRELSKPHSNYIEPPFSNQQYSTKRPLLQPQTTNTGLLKTLTNIDFGPKPQASLGIQLQQSAIAREHALATTIDHGNTSPLTMSSIRRALGSGHSGRRNYQQNRVSFSQTPQTIETNVMSGFYEQVPTDSSASLKKLYPRSTNTSRTTIHMVKTKNDRARLKQHIGLKTILVEPCKQPILGDHKLEETIPNSIEIMRRLGGPVTAFESNLRYNYRRQLNQFRNGSTKC